jgi:hypothetical protein
MEQLPAAKSSVACLLDEVARTASSPFLFLASGKSVSGAMEAELAWSICIPDWDWEYLVSAPRATAYVLASADVEPTVGEAKAIGTISLQGLRDPKGVTKIGACAFPFKTTVFAVGIIARGVGEMMGVARER